MDKAATSKSQRKKGNKFVKRLLKWRESKSKTNQPASDSKVGLAAVSSFKNFHPYS